MTQEQMIDGLFAIAKFIVRGLALIGFLAVVAAIGYTSKSESKPIREARCINSACDGQKCSPRFTRHMGECVK